MYAHLLLSYYLHIHMSSYELVVVSFPPLIGHTTTVTLCGFAYGMKGFFIASSASLFGSALVFIVLRFLFAERLRGWSTQNTKWTALESVVVCMNRCFILSACSRGL